MSPPLTIDLADLGFDRGAHLLVQRALAAGGPGATVVVTGTDPQLGVHLPAWCRARGDQVERRDSGFVITDGGARTARWTGAQRAGSPAVDLVGERADASWGLAARGALVEAGGPRLAADLVARADVWASIAPKLYAQALAGQWDPNTAIEWDTPIRHGDDIEHAVVQVMTYLIENEQAALVVPARFITRVHPYFREVMQLLAIQVADEARHVEVFTRRALLRHEELGTSSAGGRASLQTLLDEPDFPLAVFLLSVLGEGSFLSLLAFIENHAPDDVTRRVAHLVLQDEARHVAFGVAHLEQAVAADPALRGRLRAAVERRHDALASTAGLNADVFDALVVLAAGSWSASAIARGWTAVQDLVADMDDGRRRRLVRLGFDAGEAAALSQLHTRHFM